MIRLSLHYIFAAAARWLFAGVCYGGAELPAELRDLLYHPFFVFIDLRRIAAPFASYMF
jgi:hypothetical protein